MTILDKDVLTQRITAVELHLRRVEERLPRTVEEFRADPDASDSVTLHLWLAVQIVIDLGTGLCVHMDLGVPVTYRDAFARLGAAGVIDSVLAEHLSAAAGFRNLVAHAYDRVDLSRVFDAALRGPQDLRAFLRVVRDRAR